MQTYRNSLVREQLGLVTPDQYISSLFLAEAFPIRRKISKSFPSCRQ